VTNLFQILLNEVQIIFGLDFEVSQFNFAHHFVIAPTLFNFAHD